MFTSRDLALHLPTDAGNLSSLRHTASDLADDDDKKQFVPLKEKEEAKVVRYFANKAPAWSGVSNQAPSSIKPGSSYSGSSRSSNYSSNSSGNSSSSSIVKNEVKNGSSSVLDGRLSRLAQVKPGIMNSSDSGYNNNSNNNNSSSSSSSDPPVRRRRTYEAQIILETEDNISKDNSIKSDKNNNSREDLSRIRSGDEIEKEDEEREEEEANIVDFSGGRSRNQAYSNDKYNSNYNSHSNRDDGRAAAVAAAAAAPLSRRERALAKRRDDDDSESDSSSNVSSDYFSSEEAEDEEDDDDYHAVRLKPIFVPKHMRQSTASKEVEEREEEERLKRVSNEKNSRIQRTREFVAESIRRSDKEESHSMLEINDDVIPNDEDRSDDEEEFENWKLREVTRLRRDAKLREVLEAEKADILRRRNMTEEERMEEDKKLGLGKFKAQDNKKWKFLQKYYHKGAFYMDEDTLTKGGENDVRKRSYESAATGEDQFNFDALPKVLQVKDFGKRGKTKYTHLADQDTSNFQHAIRRDAIITSKYTSKMSGIGDIDNDGRLRKKEKNE